MIKPKFLHPLPPSRAAVKPLHPSAMPPTSRKEGNMFWGDFRGVRGLCGLQRSCLCTVLPSAAEHCVLPVTGAASVRWSVACSRPWAMGSALPSTAPTCCGRRTPCRGRGKPCQTPLRPRIFSGCTCTSARRPLQKAAKGSTGCSSLRRAERR